MRILISLFLSSVMLNLSSHAGSSKRKNEKDKDLKVQPHSFEKQKMEEKKYYPGFEKQNRPYTPNSLPEERIQTGG